jgi:hypothetical protein
MRHPLARLWAVLCLAFVLAACGESGVKHYPVKGKVTYKDQPTEGAQVVFQPVDGESNERPKAYGDVKADGSFTLRTQQAEGAPAGEYNVMILWFASAGPDALEVKAKLPAKYADPASPILKATVKEGNNELEPFALK